MDAMDVFIHLAGFIGAWLLVAGPLLQGAIELRDEEMDREGFEKVRGDVEYPQPISRWWWLLPPVAIYRNQKRSRDFREATMGVLTVEQRSQFVGFTNKATGWFTVAAGAFLIFLKEAWELAELFEAPLWLYILVVVVLAVAAIANTITRLSKADEIIHIDDPGYKERMRAEREAQQAEHRAQGGKRARPQRTRKNPPAADA
jgi:asparagine N-glycosylation enzyme membrane subunit Stt3